MHSELLLNKLTIYCLSQLTNQGHLGQESANSSKAPNPALFLFLLIKFYRDTTVPFVYILSRAALRNDGRVERVL